MLVLTREVAIKRNVHVTVAGHDDTWFLQEVTSPWTSVQVTDNITKRVKVCKNCKAYLNWIFMRLIPEHRDFQSFIMVLSKVHHWILYRPSWIQFTSSKLISLRYISILSADLYLDFPAGLFQQKPTTLCTISCFAHEC
jgi:hypothetical protein